MIAKLLDLFEFLGMLNGRDSTVETPLAWPVLIKEFPVSCSEKVSTRLSRSFSSSS